jgi:hypothetical protein
MTTLTKYPTDGGKILIALAMKGLINLLTIPNMRLSLIMSPTRANERLDT